MQALPPFLEAIKPFIFPVVTGTKDPATTHGWHEASNDPEQWARWERMLPGCNWGIACGLSGLLVYDIDPAGLADWAKRQRDDFEFRDEVENTFQVQTPKGGMHVYFEGEGPSTASRISDGIDTRGGIRRNGKIVSGGYVILPGSHTVAGPGRVDGAYTVLVDKPIRKLTGIMSAIIPDRKTTDVKGLETEVGKDLPRNIQTAKDILNSFVAKGSVAIEGSGGDPLTVATAAAVLSKGISPYRCFELMNEIWNPHCVPPWEPEDLQFKIESMYNSGENTRSGAEGHQSNQDAFSKFAGMETGEPEAKPAKQRPRMQLIHDYADSVEDPKWLLPGMLPEIGVGFIYGRSGSYKSFVALDLGMTVACGIPGQWQNPNPEKQDVVFFAGESPIGMARLRFPAWMEAHSIEFRTDHRMLFNPKVPFYSDAETWAAARDDIDRMEFKPALIIIDTKSRLISGMDENTSKDSSNIMHFLEQLSEYYSCCVLVIDHVGKDESKGQRGSTVYSANADFSIETKKMVRGMQMIIRKQKEADVEDSSQFFETTVFGKSIVLLKTNRVLDGANEKKAPKIEWASLKEVCEVLQKLGGSVGGMILAQTISGNVGVDIHQVSRTLSASEELKILRNGNRWELPDEGAQPLEFDL